MKKARRFWNSLPKLPRFLLNLLVITGLIFAIYTFISAPPFTSEIQYRRVEKANMIGPAEILGIESVSYSGYDRILLAYDGMGAILYAESTDRLHEPELIYREKSGNVTILMAPDPAAYNVTDTMRTATLFAFDNCPEATRAELTITLKTDYRGEAFEKTYTMESRRTNPGYFRFHLNCTNPGGLGAESFALSVLSSIAGYVGRYHMDTVLPASIRFYDNQGQLLGEEHISLRPVEAEAHIAQGDMAQ